MDNDTAEVKDRSAQSTTNADRAIVRWQTQRTAESRDCKAHILNVCNFLDVADVILRRIPVVPPYHRS